MSVITTTIILAPAAYADGTPDYTAYLEGFDSTLTPDSEDGQDWIKFGNIVCRDFRNGATGAQEWNFITASDMRELIGDPNFAKGVPGDHTYESWRAEKAAQDYICPDVKRGRP